MRTLAAFAIVIAASSFTGSAHAERYWPWCARYNGWTVVCGFASFQQCLTTISGVGGFCEQNVMPPPGPVAYGYAHKPRLHHKRRHRHRH